MSEQVSTIKDLEAQNSALRCRVGNAERKSASLSAELEKEREKAKDADEYWEDCKKYRSQIERAADVIEGLRHELKAQSDRAESAEKSLAEEREKARALEGRVKDAVTRMEAAERCSGDWMRDRNLAIRQRDKAEAQLSAFTGEKPPIFIHAGDHCPAEAQSARYRSALEKVQAVVDDMPANECTCGADDGDNLGSGGQETGCYMHELIAALKETL